jgi:hypothetical protein
MYLVKTYNYDPSTIKVCVHQTDVMSTSWQITHCSSNFFVANDSSNWLACHKMNWLLSTNFCDPNYMS